MNRILRSTASYKATYILFLGLAATTLAVAQNYASLYKFQGGDDGWDPIGFLIADHAGNLYGTTTYGGSGTLCDPFGCGTIFQLMPPGSAGDRWTRRIIHNFSGTPDGSWPSAGHLVLDQADRIYGTTQYGGAAANPYGAVFQLTPPAEPGGAWTESILYTFTDGNDGGVPANGLAVDAAGNLYGTTNDGGQYGTLSGAGTIFQLSPPQVKGGAWTETTLYSFQQIKDGNEPSDLSLDVKGNLYGTRSADNILCTPSNPTNCGTAFELQRHGTSWRMKTVHRFTGFGDGSSPSSGMILDANGNLYGSTLGFGGNIISGGGTIFELSPPASVHGEWTETLLYTFTGGADGAQPLAAPIFDSRGRLYGTTFYGGDLNCNLGTGCGVAFALAPPSQPGQPWTETVLHTFLGGSDGEVPFAGLIWGKGGALYGTAAAGGGSVACNGGCGTVFLVVP